MSRKSKIENPGIENLPFDRLQRPRRVQCDYRLQMSDVRFQDSQLWMIFATPSANC